MKKGDLVQVRDILGRQVRSLVPGFPHALGIIIPPGTPAVILELGRTRSQVLLESKLLWIYNEDMEVINAEG